MKNYIVWIFIKHEGWEPYYFDTLKNASNFIKENDKNYGSIDYLLTKEINMIVED